MPTPTRATAFLPIPAALLLLAGASGLPALAKPGHLHNRTREVWFREEEEADEPGNAAVTLTGSFLQRDLIQGYTFIESKGTGALELTEPEPDCCSLL